MERCQARAFDTLELWVRMGGYQGAMLLNGEGTCMLDR